MEYGTKDHSNTVLRHCQFTDSGIAGDSRHPRRGEVGWSWGGGRTTRRGKSRQCALALQVACH
eukprot:14406598-Alexandrium_andersonii.AAC.1